jgi:hypothetical protein
MSVICLLEGIELNIRSNYPCTGYVRRMVLSLSAVDNSMRLNTAFIGLVNLTVRYGVAAST